MLALCSVFTQDPHFLFFNMCKFTWTDCRKFNFDRKIHCLFRSFVFLRYHIYHLIWNMSFNSLLLDILYTVICEFLLFWNGNFWGNFELTQLFYSHYIKRRTQTCCQSNSCETILFWDSSLTEMHYFVYTVHVAWSWFFADCITKSQNPDFI